MKRSIWTILALAFFALVASGCVNRAEMDDLTNRVDGIDSRLSALEAAVKELNETEIPGLKNLVSALQNNVTVSSVVETDNGFVITFSDGTSATLRNGKDGKDGEDGADGRDGKDGADGTNGTDGEDGQTPVVSITIVNGVYVWTVNGEIITDNDGNPIPVTGNDGVDGTDGTDGVDGKDGITPLFGIIDGHWVISYDNGETWKTVGLTSDTDYSAYLDPEKETDDYIVLIVGATEVQIPKEKAFTLTFTVGENNGVKEGESIDFPYTISGVNASDETDVDVIGIIGDWDAEVVPETTAAGVLKVTNNGGDEAKITVYAANHKGKTDIRTLKFVAGVLEAVIETQAIGATGGEMELEVTTNMDYTIVVPEDAQDWITVEPVTKVHIDNYVITVAENTTPAFRAATLSVVDANGNTVKEIEVFQYPIPGETTSIASVLALKAGQEVFLNKVTTVVSSETSTIITDGTDFTYIPVGSLERGTVINITAGKLAFDPAGLGFIDEPTIEEVQEAEPIEVIPEEHYLYYWAANDSDCYFYTILNGIILPGGEGTYALLTADNDYMYALEIPANGLDLSSYVGKFITFRGWVKSRDKSSDLALYTFNVIPDEIEDVVMTEESAWTLTHEYDPSDPDYPEVLVNTVSGDTGYYAFTAFPESELDGLTPLEYLHGDAWYASDMLQFYIYLYEYTVEDLVADGAIHTGSSYEYFSAFDYGKTYLAAFGVDEWGCLNGKYVLVEYDKPDPKIKLSYEDYLGQWKVNGAVWTISENENGVSYFIDGIPGSSSLANRGGNMTVVADYDPEDGSLSVTEQELAAYDDPSGNGYGPLKDYFSGVFSYYFSTYCNYPVNGDAEKVFTFYGLNDGTYEMRPGSCEYGKFAGFQFQWIIQEGEYQGAGNKYGTLVDLPTTDIIKYEPVKVSYEDFLGTWDLGNAVITLTEKVSGESYNVKGLPFESNIHSGVDPCMNYDAQAGKLVFMEHDLGTFDDETYGACQEMVSGSFTYGTTQYISYPVNSKVQGVIFEVIKTSDGTMNVVAGANSYAPIDGYRLAYVTEAGSTRAYGSIALPSKFVPYEASVKASYEDFLGAWQIGGTVLEIESNGDNGTYSIYGLPGYEYYDAMQAVYDSEEGTFYVMEQDLSGWESPNYGPCRDNVSGVFAYGSSEYLYYPFNGDDKNRIFTASLKTSGNIHFDLGSCTYGSFVGLSYSWVILEGEYAGNGNWEDTLYLDQEATPKTSGSMKKNTKSSPKLTAPTKAGKFSSNMTLTAKAPAQAHERVQSTSSKAPAEAKASAPAKCTPKNAKTTKKFHK